jgi:hypothetical protein
MSLVFVQVPFKDCPLKRGNRTKHYSGLAKVSPTGPDYRGQQFCVHALLPEATFFDEDFAVIEKFLEHKSMAEILGALKHAIEAAGKDNG